MKRLWAKVHNRRHIVTDEQHGSTAFGDFAHFAEAFLLKLCVAHGQDFVNDQNLGFEMRGDGKRKPNIHAAAVAFDGCIKEFFDLGKSDDLVELAPNLLARHTQNRASSTRSSLLPRRFGASS